jgi:hypothetical protein
MEKGSTRNTHGGDVASDRGGCRTEAKAAVGQGAYWDRQAAAQFAACQAVSRKKKHGRYKVAGDGKEPSLCTGDKNTVKDNLSV